MDLIERQAAIDAVKGRFSMPVDNLIVEVIGELPSAQPDLQPTCNNLATDCISRQAAIDTLEKWLYDGDDKRTIAETLYALPSAQPEVYDSQKEVAKYVTAFSDGYDRGKADAQPEIIRCKDCGKREVCRTSTVWAVAPGDDWYCADAERGTDE